MNTHTLKDWILATRPWSFPASSMPVIVAVAYLFWSESDINWLLAFWALVNVVIFHAAGNTWSDYHDYKKGVDCDDTIGGTSITSGTFTPDEIRKLSILLFVIAIFAGVALVFIVGLPLLYIGVAGFVFTALYPFLKFHALGDVDIFLTYSFLPILGTSYVVTGAFHYSTLWLSVPIGLITVGILHINNTRDMEHDKRANITTFAMQVGGRIASWLYCFEVLFPFVWIAMCAILGILPIWTFLVLLAIKPAMDNARKAMRYPKAGMSAVIGVDEQTAKLQLMFSLLLVMSLILAKFI